MSHSQNKGQTMSDVKFYRALSMSEQIDLQDQRDELLAALRGIVDFHNSNCEDEELYPEFLEHMNVAKAVIAKVASKS